MVILAVDLVKRDHGASLAMESVPNRVRANVTSQNGCNPTKRRNRGSYSYGPMARHSPKRFRSRREVESAQQMQSHDTLGTYWGPAAE